MRRTSQGRMEDTAWGASAPSDVTPTQPHDCPPFALREGKGRRFRRTTICRKCRTARMIEAVGFAATLSRQLAAAPDRGRHTGFARVNVSQAAPAGELG